MTLNITVRGSMACGKSHTMDRARAFFEAEGWTVVSASEREGFNNLVLRKEDYRGEEMATPALPPAPQKPMYLVVKEVDFDIEVLRLELIKQSGEVVCRLRDGNLITVKGIASAANSEPVIGYHNKSSSVDTWARNGAWYGAEKPHGWDIVRILIR